MKIILEGNEVQEYLDYLKHKNTPKPAVVKHQSLFEEIEADKLKPEPIVKTCTNPFKEKEQTKKPVSKWEDYEIKSLRYCAETNIPSHKTLDYAMRKVGSNRSESAIRRMVSRLGYKIKKGEICKN